MDEVATGGTGWINIEPIIEEEHEPPPTRAVRLSGRIDPQGAHGDLDARETDPHRGDQPTTVGLAARRRNPRGLEAAGPGTAVARGLAGHPGPPPPRPGGLGAGGGRHRQVIDWLLRAATAVCQVEATGRWEAAVHAGLP